MKQIKRAFTLLEMMIALMLLSCISVLSAVQVKALVDSHRFEKQVSNLFTALQEAQVLALAFQTDIALDFFKKNGTWHYRFTTFEPFTRQQFNDQEISLSRIGKLKFKETNPSHLHFDIYSGGRIEPRGALGFYERENEQGKSLWFDLQYGHLIKYAYAKPPSYQHPIPTIPKE